MYRSRVSDMSAAVVQLLADDLMLDACGQSERGPGVAKTVKRDGRERTFGVVVIVSTWSSVFELGVRIALGPRGCRSTGRRRTGPRIQPSRRLRLGLVGSHLADARRCRSRGGWWPVSSSAVP